MFEAGLFGTLEDVAMGAEGLLMRGGNAIADTFDKSRRSSVDDGKGNKKNTVESTVTAERWFETIDMYVIKKKDGTFRPSLKEFLEEHFKGNVDDMKHIFAERMMSTEKLFTKMVNRISEFYEVPAELVRNEIDKLVGENKAQKMQEDIEAGLDPMKYVTSGSELVKILMQMENDEITEEAGIEMIKKLDEKELTLNIGAFISDIETRAKELSGVKANRPEGRKVEAESISEEKKSVSLKEAIQETALGQRLFTRMEEAVANA